ncbi:MAG: diguanylate cyclase [Gammaproteobacteria bacterium]
MDYNSRILIVDDNRSIHEDFIKVLSTKDEASRIELDKLEKELFDSDESDAKDSTITKVAYEIDAAYQGEDALNKVIEAEEEGRPYAMAYMDVRMPPGWDGVETIIRIWERYPYIEMVLCTAYSDYDWDQIISKLGCTDKLLFVRKPFDRVTIQQITLTLVKKWNLGNQSRNYVKDLEKEVESRTWQLKELLVALEKNNSELQSLNKKLEHISLHDSLTELPNRALFHDRLKHSIDVASREHQPFVLGILDIDKFKEINDNYGHVIGDKVLQEISDRLELALRASDTVARLGGDEFGIILPSVDADSLGPIIDKLIKVMEPPIVTSEHSLSVGSSLGLTFYVDHGDEECLIKCADAAMYQAKREGVNCKVFDLDAQIIDLKETIEVDPVSQIVAK